MIKRLLREGNGGVWAHQDGRTYFVPSGKSSAKKGKATSENTSDGIILSPMPGKIFKLMCKAGESVEAQQTLCIIEAMKMEYSLKAPFAGQVKSVGKQEGQQVVLGEKILEIEKK